MTSSEKNKVPKSVGEPFFLYNPCTYFQEFIGVVLKCLGLESEPQNSSSSKVKDNNDKGSCDETSSSHGPSSSEEQLGNPSLPADPTDAIERIGRWPPRPPISGGGGYKTNSSSS